MATPTYRAFRRIDSSDVEENSNGYKRHKSWWHDDNLSLINTMLERLALALVSAGGVIIPGTVAQSGDAVNVSGRMGITADGKTAVALPDTPATTYYFSGKADGYYLLVMVPTERGVAHAFSDPSTGETITQTMLDDLGGLDVAFDASAYPSTPDSAVAVAQVQVSGGSITAFAQLDEPPTYRASTAAGSVIGPGSSVDGNLAAFNGTDGLTLEDSGYAPSDFASAAQGSTADSAVQPGDSIIRQSIIIACSDETTALTTGTAKATFRMPYAFTVTEVRCSVTTAPAGSTIQVDINESGVSILSTVLSIDAGEKTSTTAATAAVISDSALADDAEITIDIDQIGSTTAGAGLKVAIIGHPA